MEKGRKRFKTAVITGAARTAITAFSCLAIVIARHRRIGLGALRSRHGLITRAPVGYGRFHICGRRPGTANGRVWVPASRSIRAVKSSPPLARAAAHRFVHQRTWVAPASTPPDADGSSVGR